jgi:3-hydroxyisobutyrate dehydrogenase-like beta-hydroxyacid dehydrogenase
MNRVAMIGLGQMGTALAKLLLGAGMEVYVWNRTGAKSEALAAAGARVAASAADAAQHADVVLLCVFDYPAAVAILSSAGMRQALHGKLLIQLTTGSPQDAKEGAASASAMGAGYLDGAIQVAPEQMGKPDTTILVSGAESDFATGRHVLEVLGGNVVYLGERITAAATMDLATLSFIYGAAAGFFQGAALAESEGLDLATYGRIVHAMSPSFGEFLRHEAKVIQGGDFAVSQSPLSISVEATERIETAMRASGLNAQLPALIAQLLRQAADAGYANEEFAAVIKLLRVADKA